jgi:DNA-binding transcriptional MocR family regulator
MTSPEPADARILYRRLAADLRAQIGSGVISVGQRMPSIRTLRRLYRVSAATAMAAYVVLEREGLVEARPRSGFYAARPAPVTLPATVRPSDTPKRVAVGQLIAEVLRRNDQQLIPFGLSTLGPDLLPNARLNRAMRRAMTRHPSHGATYGSLSGRPELRTQVARLLVNSGVPCRIDDVLITAGGMEALQLALRTIASSGDIVAVESPTYFGVLQTVEALGLKAMEVPSHPRHGIDLGLLDRALRRPRVKGAIVMTTCHNPLGSVMSDADKEALVEIVTRRGVALIEDDVYGDLVHTEIRPRPAKSFDRAGQVILCGSASKSLSPGLRIGWVMPGRYQPRMELAKSVTSRVTSALPQLGLAELLETGFFPRYIRRMRQHVTDQVSRYMAAATEMFPDDIRLTRPSGGMVLWVQLPKRLDGTTLYYRAFDHGISIMPGEIFSLGRRHRHFVRISCAHPWTTEIEQGLWRLARLMKSSAV